MQDNVVVSAEVALIEKARARAHAWGTTLEDELRRWLESYAGEDSRLGRVSRGIWRRWKSSGISVPEAGSSAEKK